MTDINNTNMKNKVIDQDIREELLNTAESFIVQAPAGSGKTEILTQRILALLSIVNKPENILAITFTRKAAAEMQSRVVKALESAQLDEPQAEHEKVRWQLARKVLSRDDKKGWSLVKNPTRLKVMTIDSFSSSLSQALPLVSQTGALPNIIDNAEPFYQQAAENLLESIAEDSGDKQNPITEKITQLLKRKDNNLPLVTGLISKMLSKRLQWMTSLNYHLQDFNEEHLLDSFQIIITQRLQQLYQVIPENIRSELPQLINQASQILSLKPNIKKNHLINLEVLDRIYPPEFEDLQLWIAIAQLLLSSKEGELVKRFDVRHGFPKEKDGKDENEKEQFKRNKDLISQIATELNQIPEFVDGLFEISLFSADLDSFFENGKLQDESLQSALMLLPIAVAHLKLIFSQNNAIDYPELAIAAIEALGHEDNPSDLALSLDYRIEHILIDEFQDTSTPQIKLLKLLTSGWQKGDGKTLFLVGDPMQSIYRFRDANVSFFMQIRDQGLGTLSLESRKLQVNFRSDHKVVDWVNKKFSQVMPKTDELTYSAVSYAESSAFNYDRENAKVETLITLDKNDHYLQAEKVLTIVKQHLKENETLSKDKLIPKSLAVLVRSRSHLTEIIELLNQNEIIFEAVDIDKLVDKSHIKDLMALAFSLCDQYDELSWATIMRSPWFSLPMNDIYKILNQSNLTLPLPKRIESLFDRLSKIAQERIHKILPILNASIQFKGQKPFDKWLLGCFKAVGAYYQLDLLSELEDIKVCLNKLTDISDGGELNDRELVYDAIKNLYASTNTAADGQIQIMTIHKSKGLEFDKVILPRLDAGNPPPDLPLVNWTEVIDKQGNPHHLLAISKETGKEADASYRYISYIDKKKAYYENQRLLYVAATRAKQQLYLLANVKTKEAKEVEGSHDEIDSADLNYVAPVKNSLLSLLWDYIKSEVKIYHTTEELKTRNSFSNVIKGENILFDSRYIKRVNLSRVYQIDNHNKEVLVNDFSNSSNQVGIDSSRELASIIGSTIHRQLQWISENYDDGFSLPENWQELTKRQLQSIYTFKDKLQLDSAIDRVTQSINRTLSDEMGMFILKGSNSAASEINLYKKLFDYRYVSKVVDRTFIQDNKRWIIDYKSSQPNENESFKHFIDREKSSYDQQINEYVGLFQELENMPIVAGLYFPMLAHFEILIEENK